MTRDDVVELLGRLAARHDDLKVKGKASAYLAINGNMFAFVDGSGELCMRLSKEDRAAYAEAGHDASDVIRYNSVMRDYVAVSPELVADEAGVKDWFERSVGFARALKPKPTKKTAPAKKS